jgi:hypothetical protein
MLPAPRPQITATFSGLPTEPKERHEALVDVLGELLLSLRNWSVAATRRVLESSNSQPGTLTPRESQFAGLADLSPEQRELVGKLSQVTTDRFIQLLLTMLGGTGVDQRLGDEHAIRFKLDLEICRVDTHDVVEVETLNRGGKKFFGDYWGRWINRF